jgi:hypothetical protein
VFKFLLQKAGMSSLIIFNPVFEYVVPTYMTLKFYSYTEVELVCEYNGAKYNILQAAHKAKPGKYLAEALQISTTDDVLFATFSIGKVNSKEPLNDTAVCFYPLKAIKNSFTKLYSRK